MDDLLQNQSNKDTPVECLGQTFPNDQARREHFLTLLAEKLKDPEFRNQEGFPQGTDEAILTMSDPPYYTACPNPFIEDYIRVYGTPYDPSVPYDRKPFFADVSEGKYDPLYKLHPYHTKVPHRAIMRYILQYTKPGDLVLDAYAGSGATGVAAQLCGNETVVKSLGYEVDSDGAIFHKEENEEEGSSLPFSKVGARKAILNDLSPVASYISYIYNTPSDQYSFQSEAKKLLRSSEKKHGWMFQTLHNPTKDQIQSAIEIINTNSSPDLSGCCGIGRVNYTVWSDVFTCPECAGDIVFWETAVDIEGGKVNQDFNCPSCGSSLTKRSMERKWHKIVDPYLDQIVEQAIQVPVLINYKVGTKRFQKVPDQADIALIKKTESLRSTDWCPTFQLPIGFNTRQPIESHGLTHVHHFYTGRNRIALSAFNALCDKPMLKSLVTTVAFRITKRYGLLISTKVSEHYL
ncbi:DNA methyltransferase [uncultured Marinobacter sp.]|uniref:DNA methyltransferase n=1 Tax=uncultured Marinobacter sp. TaxID=187379 RepID=UPI0030DD953C|tara:strand:- start:7 stop:1392 length:1386 start_codon:yes stop_codon:yes gene_type:complete